MTRVVCFMLTLCYSLIFNCSQAQKRFSTYLGIGLGRHFEKPFPCIEQKNNGRLAIQLIQYARLSPKYSLGISAQTSGRWSSILGGASAPGDYFDPITNSQIINFNNLNAATYLIRNKYDWFNKGDFTFYSDLGLGISNYRYQHTARSSFSFAPEIGFANESFQLAATFVWGGKTPAFMAYSTMPNYIILNSITSNRLYFTFSYRLFTF